MNLYGYDQWKGAEPLPDPDDMPRCTDCGRVPVRCVDGHFRCACSDYWNPQKQDPSPGVGPDEVPF